MYWVSTRGCCYQKTHVFWLCAGSSSSVQVCHCWHFSCTFCADQSAVTVQVQNKWMVHFSFMWRWQCISVCSLILQQLLRVCRKQSITNIIYKSSSCSPTQTHWLIDWWDWLLTKTRNSFVLTFLCFPKCAWTLIQSCRWLHSPVVVCQLCCNWLKTSGFLCAYVFLHAKSEQFSW